MASHYTRDGKPVRIARFSLTRGGKVERVSTGTTDKGQAGRFCDRLELLIAAHGNGDPPPMELRNWINGLPEQTAKKLSGMGLIDLRRREAAKGIMGHIDDWRGVVEARKGNTKEHAKCYRWKLKRIARDLGWAVYDDIDPDATAQYLRDRELSPSTQNKYLTALESFCEFMYTRGRASSQRVKDIEKPRPVPQWDRRPLEPAEWDELQIYLSSLDRYAGQNAAEKWTGKDRRLIYWTAVYTAFRKSELQSLRRHNLMLDGPVAFVTLAAKDAKNRTAATVPIPHDLAEELRKHAANLDPDEPLFWITKGKNTHADGHGGGAKGALQRDLEAAGLGALLETGQRIDFHTLRATAITWWLEHAKLSPERVRRLARLGSLAMVQRYIRGARFDDFSWLDSSPKSITATKQAKAAG